LFVDRFGSFIQGVAWKSLPDRGGKGKLGVLLPGLGAMSRHLWRSRAGSQRQSAAGGIAHANGAPIRLGKVDAGSPLIKKFVPACGVDRTQRLAGWDIFKEARRISRRPSAGVLNRRIWKGEAIPFHLSR